MPGFTDSKDEFLEFKKLIRLYRVDMVQWRNLNYDPVLYFRKLKLMPGKEELAGIKEIIKSLRKDFPRLRMGYFNPSTTRRFAPRVRG
jgi:peptidyl-tRNA hydrolase